jgi:holin-like protein
VLHYFVPLPVPASVYGLFIMLVCLLTKIIKLDQVETTAEFFLLLMPITLVPASVGIIAAWTHIKPYALSVIAVILISTVLVMASTGVVSQFVIKKTEAKKK